MIRNLVIAAAVAGLSLAAIAPSSASAETQWQRHHPRRTEVNARLAHQDRRIDRERREGEITRGQARALHKDDRQIRHEERDMASQDNGHITKSEKRVLNQQENAVSKDIGR